MEGWEKIWAEIRTAPVGATIQSFDGPMMLVDGGRVAPGDGRDWAALTSDGRAGHRFIPCRCKPAPAKSTLVRYEVWTFASGRISHGYLCPTCRFEVEAR
jgi:hypothetical protein